ncbi:7,8-didemethyl-8-hydroxy-5-deazariboflavin synthase CofG [Rhizorhabdus dicambivorans]|nr:7,8-didemethyl-8-hydroxy-5-deazariboflavin synthase CofG [Rhizorhabdus dicambivorans]
MIDRRRSSRIRPRLAALLEMLPLPALMAASETLTLEGHGTTVTYSPSVRLRLASVDRDPCHCCPSTKPPRDALLKLARDGAALGCREALLTLDGRQTAPGGIPRPAPVEFDQATSLSHLAEMARVVLDETALLPHLDPGLLTAADYVRLRPHAASMRIMLESGADRLCDPGGPHHGSPDKGPARRLAAIRAAGRARVPLATGLPIGIGETRSERIEALAAIRDIHRRHGHIQQVAIHDARPDAPAEEHLWTIAAARLILGPQMTIQAPPDLRTPDALGMQLRAGVNDWGSVHPDAAEPAHPEAPWAHRNLLEQRTRAAGRRLVERLAIGPRHALDADKWVDPALAPRIGRAIDARGLPRRRRAHLVAVT